MSTSTATPPTQPMSSSKDRSAFFRQSSWMILATTAGGVFMWAVHVLANRMEPAEYGVFFTLLRVFILMGFPAAGLQIIFAQHAAATISAEENARLSGATRSVLQGTFAVWLVMALLIFAFQGPLLEMLKIRNPAALWVTVLLGLASLWAPVVKGLLQGTQNFGGLGWVILIDGVGRFTATAFILQMGGQAAGAMAGALMGQLVSLGIGFWLTRRIWTGPRGPFAWAPWFKKVVPLTAGVGVVLFMTSADVIYVQSLFPKERTPSYMAAAMIGYALIVFTTPLAAVMFPKVVKSAALLQRTDAMQQTLIATACVGGLAALVFTLFPELPLRIIFFKQAAYWESAPLVPWFAWGLLPLMLANVLVGNLLAQGRFKAVPWMTLVALGYAGLLWASKSTLLSLEPFKAFKLVVGILGASSLALFLVTVRFSREP